MTVAVIDLFGAGASGLHPVGARIALWVRDIPAKALAREFGVAEQTAKGWRRGNLPQMGHFSDMVERWREPFLDFVFAPVLAEMPDLVARLDAMERRAVNFARDVADLKQQVTHEQMANRRGGDADARGRDAGDVARPLRQGRKAAARAVALAVLLVALAGPVLDLISPPAWATVADLADQDDDHAARLHKVARRPVRSNRRDAA